MKRLLTIGLMLASAFALTNCAEQLESPYQEDAIVDEKIDDTIVPEEGIVGNFEVYTVDEDTKTGFANNAITWISGTDKISVYSTPSADTPSYVKHGPFTNNGGQRFTGDLKSGYTLSNQNNWYFIYPYTTQNPSSTSTIQETLTIGSATQVQDISSNGVPMAHLAGDNCPMYAIINNVAKDRTPKKKMSLLYSIVELKIKNVSDNSNSGQGIVLNRVEFAAPEEIIGTFTVKNLENVPSFEALSASSETKVTFTSEDKPSNLTIKSGDEYSVYLVIKPFNASNKDITLSINGSSKKVKMPYDFNFEAGKITTLNIPVKNLSYGSIETNLLDDMGTVWEQGDKALSSYYWAKEGEANMLVLSDKNGQTMNINGENVNVFTLGTATISGTAHDLIQKIPIEFYASSMNGKKAVMRVDGLTANISAGITIFGQRISVYKGVSRDFAGLSGLMNPERIKFTQLVPLDVYDNNIVILDEEPIHKKIDTTAVATLLQKFDENANDDLIPTYEGLFNAITNPSSINDTGSKAAVTAQIIFDKVSPIVDDVLSASLDNTLLKAIAGAMLGSPYNFFDFMANYVSLSVKLSTVPIGTDGATDDKVIVWGLNSPKSN